jgi:hypothetical protein
LFLERHECVAWTELARQAFEEIEDDSSSSSSSSNSSISSGSSMDMSDDNDDEWSDDNNISDGELSFAFSSAFDKASTIANKFNQLIEHQGIQWRRKHGLKIVELSSDDGLTFFGSGPSTYKNCLTSSGHDFLVTLLGRKRRFVLEKRSTLPLLRLFCSCAYIDWLDQIFCAERWKGFSGKKSKISAGVRAIVDA